MIVEKIKQVVVRAEETAKKMRNSQHQIDLMKQYLILASPSLEGYKKGFKREEVIEKQKAPEDYKDITEEAALKEIRERKSYYVFEASN